MVDAPIALALSAGLVATVNPCGFAMLPAHVSYFLGLDGGAPPLDRREGLARALRVGAAVSAGFLAVFATTGALVTAGLRWVIASVPWLAIVIGVALIVLGVALLRGRHLTVALPGLRRLGRSRRTGSAFVFGVAYALASLSCTLPVFLAVVGATLTRTSVLAGLATFVAYGLGMSLVLVALTLALALAKDALVRRLRAALPYVNRAAGALLVASGAYLVYYWVFNLTASGGATMAAAPARFVEDLAGRVTGWITELGAVLPLVLAGFALAALVVARRRPRRPDVEGEPACTAPCAPGAHPSSEASR